MSHGNLNTFPRLAYIVGFLPSKDLESVTRAVLTVHRDFGDRTNRKHARLKYVIAERGVDWFRAQVEQRTGLKLAPARPFQFTSQRDLLGWHQQTNGNWFLGLFVENGRIRDDPGYQLRTGLRQAIEKYLPEVRLTASQNILLVNIPPVDRSGLEQLLSQHGVSVSNPFGKVRLASMACPAMPTCGLALAESERVLPSFVTRLESLLTELGLNDEEIILRMTGCPNGCARPYVAEIALVGKAPNKYQLYLGGNEASTRLNRVYLDSVKSDDLLESLRPVLMRFRDQRQTGERFGDFCARVLWTEPASAPA
jgi:sulfite reductase (NADPH) hemoprotein beta-component